MNPKQAGRVTVETKAEVLRSVILSVAGSSLHTLGTLNSTHFTHIIFTNVLQPHGTEYKKSTSVS